MMNSKSGHHGKTSRVWEKSSEILKSRLHSKERDHEHHFSSAEQPQKLVVQQTSLEQNRFLFSAKCQCTLWCKLPNVYYWRSGCLTTKSFATLDLQLALWLLLDFMRWEVAQEHSRLTGTIVVETKDGTTRIGTFRDGASFVVKVDLVQDILDAMA